MIHLCRVELAAGLVLLAEEVTDEPLGALVWGLEVRRELGVDVPAEIKKPVMRCNLKYSMGRRGKVHYP